MQSLSLWLVIMLRFFVIDRERTGVWNGSWGLLKAALLLFKCVNPACSARRAWQQHISGRPLLFLWCIEKPEGSTTSSFCQCQLCRRVFLTRVSRRLLRVHLCRTTGTQLCICAVIPISCSSAELFILPPVYSAEVREHKVSWNKPAGWSLMSGGGYFNSAGERRSQEKQKR